MVETVPVSIEADTEPLERALRDLTGLAKQFGSQMSGALKDAVVGGRALDDILRQLAMSLAGMALEQGLRPLDQLFSSLFAGIFPNAQGGVPGRPVPFAQGGVVSAPTYFPMDGAIGLMGEAGTEAILPLRRGADGNLGVIAQGGAAPVTVNFHVTTPDPATFRKSQAQITGMLARAATRGMRSR